jgi:metallo-beta-lactamase family protein
MKLSFYGADREVTGSCHGVEIRGKKLLVDCGLVQGSDNDYGQEFPFDPADIDCVVVPHALFDHWAAAALVKQGYKKQDLCQRGTVRIREIHAQGFGAHPEIVAGWKSRKRGAREKRMWSRFTRLRTQRRL